MTQTQWVKTFDESVAMGFSFLQAALAADAQAVDVQELEVEEIELFDVSN